MAHTPVNRIFLGTVVPVAMYAAGRKMGMPFPGALSASIWGLALLGWYWRKLGEFDGFAGIGAAYAVSELVGLFVTRDAGWFLLSPVISDVVLGSFFLASMLMSRPLIQVLAEQMSGIEAFPEAVRESVHYRHLWFRLSLLWGGVYVCKGVAAWAILEALSEDAYLGARVALGWPVMAALMAFSFWYPKRYWRRVV